MLEYHANHKAIGAITKAFIHRERTMFNSILSSMMTSHVICKLRLSISVDFRRTIKIQLVRTSKKQSLIMKIFLSRYQLIGIITLRLKTHYCEREEARVSGSSNEMKATIAGRFEHCQTRLRNSNYQTWLETSKSTPFYTATLRNLKGFKTRDLTTSRPAINKHLCIRKHNLGQIIRLRGQMSLLDKETITSDSESKGRTPWINTWSKIMMRKSYCPNNTIRPMASCIKDSKIIQVCYSNWCHQFKLLIFFWNLNLERVWR